MNQCCNGKRVKEQEKEESNLKKTIFANRQETNLIQNDVDEAE
jgi:hypothetical protein